MSGGATVALRITLFGRAGHEWCRATRHEHQPVSEGEHPFEPVLRHHHGQAEVVHESSQRVQHFLGRCRIESRSRLVEDRARGATR